MKIVRFSPVFSFICSVFRAANLPDPHRDPHAKDSESVGEDICLILSAALCFSAACSHDLRHEIAHLFGCAFLHLPCDVGVGAKGKPCVEVTEHTGYCFYVHAVL